MDTGQSYPPGGDGPGGDVARGGVRPTGTDGGAPSARQRVAVELAAGTALYSIVLALFDDYTDLLSISSFSLTLGLAAVMHLMTAATFAAKCGFVARHARRGRPGGTVGQVLGMWFILFSSKFVFLWVIEALFPRNVQLSGVVGLMAVIAAFTVTDRVGRAVYDKLG